MRASHHDRKYRRYQCHVNASPVRKGAVYCCGGVLVFALAAILTFVWTQSALNNTSNRLQNLRREFALKAKEAENLRTDLEAFKGGRYILTAVDRLRLGLRPPLPGQVYRVSMDASSDGSDWPGPAVLASK